jgi:hypothetical protein
MAVANGYGKVVTSGSVFMYDTGDTFNSYKGQPGTNITTGAGRNYNGYSKITYDNGMFFETNGYTEVVNIPALGPTTVQSVEINNAYCGYGCNGNYNCCPNLFNYTGGWMSSIWTPGQTYSYQIIYKCTSGYTNPNFMYHYEYNSSEGYLTEYGVFTTDKQESLGDGWYHAWNTFTAQPTAAKGYTGLWYYQYNVADKLSIAAVSISPGDTIRPPRQIIPSGTTRTATQGLLPIVGNSTINLSNVSFDSNAQIVFDGTDDFIDTNFPATTLNTPSIEAVVYRSTNTGRYEAIIQNNVDSDDALYVYPNGTLGFWPCVSSNLTVPTGQWSYVAVSYDGTNLVYCVNGVIQTVTATCTHITDWDFLRIGAYGTGDGERWIGKIAVSKVYDRALTANEFKQNYNKYKTRFNLP